MKLDITSQDGSSSTASVGTVTGENVTSQKLGSEEGDEGFFVDFIVAATSEGTVAAIQGITYSYVKPLDVAVMPIDEDRLQVSWYSTYDYSQVTASISDGRETRSAMCQITAKQGEVQNCTFYDLSPDTSYNITLTAIYNNFGYGPIETLAAESVVGTTEVNVEVTCGSDTNSNYFSQYISYNSIPQPKLYETFVEATGGVPFSIASPFNFFASNHFYSDGYFQYDVNPPIHFYGYPTQISIGYYISPGVVSGIQSFSVSYMSALGGMVGLQFPELDASAEQTSLFNLTQYRITNVRGSFDSNNVLATFGLMIKDSEGVEANIPTENSGCYGLAGGACDVIIAQPAASQSGVNYFLESFQLATAGNNITGIRARYIAIDLPRFLLNDRADTDCKADINPDYNYIRKTYYSKELTFDDCMTTKEVVSNQNGGNVLDLNYVLYSQTWIRQLDFENSSTIMDILEQEEAEGANTFVVTFMCKIDAEGGVSSASSILEQGVGESPQNPSLLSASHALLLVMSFYGDPGYSREFAGTPTYVVGERVYYSISPAQLGPTSHWSQGVLIRAASCWATKTPDPQSVDYYELENDMCPVDDTWSRSDLSTNFIDKMFFQAFEWGTENGGASTVYLHCEVFVCYLEGLSDSSCNPECSTNRHRRALREDTRIESNVISHKTHIIFLNTHKVEQLIEPPDAVLHVEFIATDSTAMFVVIFLVVISAAIISKIARLPVKFGFKSYATEKHV